MHFVPGAQQADSPVPTGDELLSFTGRNPGSELVPGERVGCRMPTLGELISDRDCSGMTSGGCIRRFWLNLGELSLEQISELSPKLNRNTDGRKIGIHICSFGGTRVFRF